MDTGASRTTNGGKVSWSYQDIMEKGSTELREIVFILCNGYKPGTSIKESDKNVKNPNH